MSARGVHGVTGPVGPAYPPAWPKLVERVRPSIVRVRGGGPGAGGVMWRTGTVLTNRHVLGDGAPVVRVTCADGRDCAARVLAASPELDLAVLTIIKKRGICDRLMPRSLQRPGELR